VFQDCALHYFGSHGFTALALFMLTLFHHGRIIYGLTNISTTTASHHGTAFHGRAAKMALCSSTAFHPTAICGPPSNGLLPQSHNCADVTYDHSSLTSAQCSDLAVLQFLQRNYFCSTPSVGRQTMQLNSASNSLLSIVLMLLSESQHAGLAYVQTVDNSRSVHCCIPICWQLSRVALHSPRCTGSVHRQMSTDRHI